MEKYNITINFNELNTIDQLNTMGIYGCLHQTQAEYTYLPKLNLTFTDSDAFWAIKHMLTKFKNYKPCICFEMPWTSQQSKAGKAANI